jgi:uncharacterized membrane protein (UPF0127 family)
MKIYYLIIAMFLIFAIIYSIIRSGKENNNDILSADTKQEKISGMLSDVKEIEDQSQPEHVFTVSFADEKGNVLTNVTVELAVSQEQRAKGLMFRKFLPQDQGMLFLFEEEDEQVFYMKNTYIPLDMIFIDAEFRVVGIIENAKPVKEDNLTVHEPSRYVLEVNAFFAKKNGIRKGTKAIFGTGILEKKEP